MVDRKKEIFVPVESFRPKNGDVIRTVSAMFKLDKNAQEKLSVPYGVFFFFNDDDNFHYYNQNTTEVTYDVFDEEEKRYKKVKGTLKKDNFYDIMNYRKSLRRTLRKMLGIDAKLNEYDYEIEIFDVSRQKANPNQLILLGNSFLDRKREQYNIFGDRLCDFILTLTHTFYYKGDGRSFQDRDDKILEECYKKAIEICKPIKAALEAQLEDEFSVSDNLTKALKGGL
jgi:hypothetical protein